MPGRRTLQMRKTTLGQAYALSTRAGLVPLQKKNKGMSSSSQGQIMTAIGSIISTGCASADGHNDA